MSENGPINPSMTESVAEAGTGAEVKLSVSSAETGSIGLSAASQMDPINPAASVLRADFHDASTVYGRDVEEDLETAHRELERLDHQQSEPHLELDYTYGGTTETIVSKNTDNENALAVEKQKQKIVALEKVDRRNYFIEAPEQEDGPEPDEDEEPELVF